MTDKYKDIINLPHKQSTTRPHMPVADRAAQFAPFAALVGYDDAVRETARLTDKKIELSDTQIELLNAKIAYIKDNLSDRIEVTITYFQEDTKKSGGAYLDYTGVIKRIDDYERIVVMQDSKEIFIEDIVEIESPSFHFDEY